MIFRPKPKTLLMTRLLRIDDTIIEEVEGIKFLGVHVDHHFAWKTHINYICTKILLVYWYFPYMVGFNCPGNE